MKFLIQIILTTLLSYLVAQLLPWWSLVICAAVVAMPLNLSQKSAAWGGFVSISLLWMGTATFIDVQTDSTLSNKVAPLLGFQSAILLILLTGLVGGIVGGLGAWSGQQIATRLLHRRPQKVIRRY